MLAHRIYWNGVQHAVEKLAVRPSVTERRRKRAVVLVVTVVLQLGWSVIYELATE